MVLFLRPFHLTQQHQKIHLGQVPSVQGHSERPMFVLAYNGYFL